MNRAVTSSCDLTSGQSRDRRDDIMALVNLSSLYAHHADDGLNTTPFSFSNATAALNCDNFHRYCTYRIVIDVFLVSLLCIAGFVGNTLAIIVLRTDCVNYTVSFLLQALAVADNVYLVACLFIQTFKSLETCTDWVPGLERVFPYMEPYVWPLASIAQTVTVWLVVVVTADRYLAICRPLSDSRLSTASRVRRVVLGVVIVAAIYNLPRFFEKYTVIMPHKCKMRLVAISKNTPLRANRFYFIIYKTAMYMVFRIILPMGTLLVLNSKLILILRDVRHNHAAMTNSHLRNDSFTTILVAMVSVFILCEAPDSLLRVFVMVKRFLGQPLSVHYVNTITNMMLTVNSAINCLVYCLMGRRFRKILKRLFCKRMTRRGNKKSFKTSFTSSRPFQKENIDLNGRESCRNYFVKIDKKSDNRKTSTATEPET